MKRFLSHWLKHGALNLGVALEAIGLFVEALFFAVLPPQSHHTPEELDGFDDHGAAWWFVEGAFGHERQEDQR